MIKFRVRYTIDGNAEQDEGPGEGHPLQGL